jgi:hypothetical protein
MRSQANKMEANKKDSYHSLVPSSWRRRSVMIDKIPKSVLIRVTIAKRHQRLEFSVFPRL